MEIIGIDLGTTNSLAACWRDGRLELIPCEDRSARSFWRACCAPWPRARCAGRLITASRRRFRQWTSPVSETVEPEELENSVREALSLLGQPKPVRLVAKSLEGMDSLRKAQAILECCCGTVLSGWRLQTRKEIYNRNRDRVVPRNRKRQVRKFRT